ncbi:hypothetical protein Tco_0251335 [Tanacetum coccineum]
MSKYCIDSLKNIVNSTADLMVETSKLAKLKGIAVDLYISWNDWTLLFIDTTKAHQKALDDALVAPENRLKIGKCNQRLSPTLKSNEPTIQVALEALKLTLFYNAFEVSADVPEIYMQEFWATVTKHHFSLRFKMNGKIHTVNVDNFRDTLKICPKLPGQKFKDPPFE